MAGSFLADLFFREIARAAKQPPLVSCYCSGRCRELGYCPSNPPWMQQLRKPRIRVKAGREVVS